MKNMRKIEQSWIMTNDRIKDEAKQNFKNTDYAL